jgi:hypothetical protein
MPEYKKDGYTFIAPSSVKGKKYDAYKDGKKIASFGAIHPNGVPYAIYHDRIGHYSKYDHLDEERRERYHYRHPHDYPKDSPDYLSKRYLW